MSDPLSIAASIAGLITITGKVGVVLKSFVSSLHDAPESARRALASVVEMRGILQSVRTATDRLEGLPRSRKQMVHYRNIAVVFRESVIAFSELEATVGLGAGTDWTASTWDRTKWVLHEGSVQRCITRMESLMGSLSLMLNILQW
jgi:cell division control protein 24